LVRLSRKSNPYKTRFTFTYRVGLCNSHHSAKRCVSSLNPPAILYPGLSGEANIIISEEAEVLTIPLAYIIDKHKVKLANGDLVEIETGRKNMEAIEVVSGIDTSTLILKPE